MITAKTLQPALRKIAGGTFFTAVNVKKSNGEVRTYNCRFGVTKGVTGQGMSYDPMDKNIMIVWDRKRKDFRAIKVDTLKEIRVRGILMTFLENQDLEPTHVDERPSDDWVHDVDMGAK